MKVVKWNAVNPTSEQPKLWSGHLTMENEPTSNCYTEIDDYQTNYDPA